MRVVVGLAMIISGEVARAAPCRAAEEVCTPVSVSDDGWQFDLSVPLELGVTSRESVYGLSQLGSML